MAKMIKTKKVRRLNLFGFTNLTLFVALAVYFVAAIFIRTENARLIRHVENTKYEIVLRTEEKDDLAKEINNLGDYANIVEKAEAAGLEYHVENSYFVKAGE